MSIQEHFPYYGATPFFSVQSDPRCSYCLYVPPAYYSDDVKEVPLVVAVHGTRRTAEGYRDAFSGFADQTSSVILAPLFPMGLTHSHLDDPHEVHNYKYLRHGGIRFDHLLNAMVDEVRGVLGKISNRFMLFGFSGGAQFAHRYFYLHPGRLAAVSVGAPGTVTRLSQDEPWWPGTANIEEKFGQPLDLDAMRNVSVQLVVGSEDTETWNVTVKEGSSTWVPGANDAGRNRVERLASLRDNLEQHGIQVEHVVVPGVGHNGLGVIGSITDFFLRCTGGRAEG